MCLHILPLISCFVFAHSPRWELNYVNVESCVAIDTVNDDSCLLNVLRRRLIRRVIMTAMARAYEKALWTWETLTWSVFHRKPHLASLELCGDVLLIAHAMGSFFSYFSRNRFWFTWYIHREFTSRNCSFKWENSTRISNSSETNWRKSFHNDMVIGVTSLNRPQKPFTHLRSDLVAALADLQVHNFSHDDEFPLSNVARSITQSNKILIWWRLERKKMRFCCWSRRMERKNQQSQLTVTIGVSRLDFFSWKYIFEKRDNYDV